MQRIWWWNHRRLHPDFAYHTPVEAEIDYYAHHDLPLEALATQDQG